MATRTMFRISLFLLLLFQLGGHSPTVAHEGSRLLPAQQQRTQADEGYQLLPSQAQHTQGSIATARWEEGWKGGPEDAGDVDGYVGDNGGGKQLKRSGKTSGGGESGPGGGGGRSGGESGPGGGGRSGGPGSGGMGGHDGGGEATPRPRRNSGAGSSRAFMATGPAQGAILMLLSTIIFPI